MVLMRVDGVRSDPDVEVTGVVVHDASKNQTWDIPVQGVHFMGTHGRSVVYSSADAHGRIAVYMADILLPTGGLLAAGRPGRRVQPEPSLDRYDVPEGGGRITLRVYDVAGRLVRTLVDEVESAGEKSVTWDGRNSHGSRVATGVYFYRMTAPGFEMTKKMVMLQ